MTSIPGIGEQKASVLLTEIRDVPDYNNARQLAAYAGLTPCEGSSGTCVKGKTRLSGIGNVRLRKALYLPAVVAMRYNSHLAPFSRTGLLTMVQDLSYNPLLKAMSERLWGRFQVKIQVIGALMRKMVHLALGILKSQKLFDPNYLLTPP